MRRTGRAAGWPWSWSPPTAGQAPSSGPGSFRNAIVALAAIGGSTNGVVHLLALAGRLGIELTLEDFDRIGSGVPLLVDLQPAGRHLMDDFHRAGGLRAVLREVADLLDPEAGTVTGRPLVEHLADAELVDTEVIRPRDRPLQEAAGIAVLRGNLAPNGAVIKHIAADPRLLQHTGPAVVFDGYADLLARLHSLLLREEAALLALVQPVRGGGELAPVPPAAAGPPSRDR